MRNDFYIEYWARMLNESSHESYYKMYMIEHPEDKQATLMKSLAKEFADSLKQDHIDLNDCLNLKGLADIGMIEKMQASIKHKYRWNLIKAQVYAAIISRSTALAHRAKGQKFTESDIIEYNDVVHNVSRRVIESCLDIMCHNTNVLEANNALSLRYDASTGPDKMANEAFKAAGIPAIPNYMPGEGIVTDFFPASMLYKAWASYAKGTAGEKYVCDSDNGPNELRKVLDSVEHSADDFDLVIALNKALDVVHFRSDLAAAFIEGGQTTCAMVSNLPDKFVV